MEDEKEYLAWISDEKEVTDKLTNDSLAETDFTEEGPSPAELEEISEDPWREDPSERGKTKSESETDMDLPAENVKEQEFFEDPLRPPPP